MVSVVVSLEERMLLENRLRRRFYRLGIWVESEGWDSSYLKVSVRSYKGGNMHVFSVYCLDGYGEVNLKKTYRELRGKIKVWIRSL